MEFAMTFRDRLLNTLHGRPTDVMPWFADLTYWRQAATTRGTLAPQYEGDAGLVRLHADHNCGYYLGYSSVWTEWLDGVEVVHESEGDLATTRWRTPVGEIWRQDRYLPSTFSHAPVKWPVATPEDLRALRYIADATVRQPEYSRHEKHDELAGDQGHPTILPPRSPVSQMLAQWTGVTNLAYLLADAREEVEAAFDALARSADSAFDAIVASDAPYIEFGDNLTGEVVTRLFERYQADYYVRRAEQIHAAGKLLGTHLDGTVHGILPLIVGTGLDFVESITPAPVGDVTIEELRDLAGPGVLLIGGIPGAMFAPPFTADDIRRQVETLIEHHWGSGRFIIAAADQVPPNGDMALVRLIGDLCEELCR